jgi:gas vesicle protein
MTRDHKVGILTFGLGAGVGAVTALLFAPKAGEELRGDIAAGVSDGVNQVRGTGKDLKRRAQKFVALAQDNVQDVMETGQNAYAHAKKGVSLADKSKRR